MKGIFFLKKDNVKYGFFEIVINYYLIRFIIN